MKLAVSGKGGVGKTTFSSLLARTLSDEGKRVLAIDADPDANQPWRWASKTGSRSNPSPR
jgi:CO dehydrogenase nickel-insertion accessory protein CooC1